jgi:hypothetical protein
MATIFYSWQSKYPETNRDFIQEALVNAAQRIRDDGSIKAEPEVVEAVRGQPGSPDIVKSIFGRIDESLVFVCDVSIINASAVEVEGMIFNNAGVPTLKSKPAKPTSNPNVLVELGYAMAHLKPERVLMVMNESFGTPEELPFDFRGRRCITYNLLGANNEKTSERKGLEEKLEQGLREIFETPFDYLEGTWDHLTSDKVRFEDGRKTEIIYIGHGKLQVETHTPQPNGRWTGRIKMDQDMPEWGEGYYIYEHGRESGRQIIMVEDRTWESRGRPWESRGRPLVFQFHIMPRKSRALKRDKAGRT